MERWPPSYDEEELASSINSLVNSTAFEADFFQLSADRNNLSFHQGDIICFNSGLPLIDEDGEPGIYEEFYYWLIIGNTCDITSARPKTLKIHQTIQSLINIKE